MTTISVLLLHHRLNKTPTAANQLHVSNILTFCMSTEHVHVSAIQSHFALRTTTITGEDRIFDC